MRRLTLLACVPILLTACSRATPPTEQRGQTSSTVSSSSARETKNVSYQGIVEALGPGIAMQGSHQLRLSDGRIVLLESRDIDLNPYLGKRIGAFGATRPTVEGVTIIMRVEEVILLEEEEEGGEDQSAAPLSSSTLPISSLAPPPAASSPALSASPSSSPETGGTDTVPATLDTSAAIMAKEDMAPHRWTQQYCSAHIGFCIPVHKNWWYKSFGTTTSSLWHLEVNHTEVQNLGEGPIVVKLLSGNVASAQATDGEIQTDGPWVRGFRSWGGSEHFEIAAPASLKAAVEYMTAHLTTSEAP